MNRARLGREVSESWMPAVTGVHFLPFFVLFVWMLNQLPRPTAHDAEERHEQGRRHGKEGQRSTTAARGLHGVAHPVLEQVEQVAPAGSTVLVEGETGEFP